MEREREREVRVWAVEISSNSVGPGMLVWR